MKHYQYVNILTRIESTWEKIEVQIPEIFVAIRSRYRYFVIGNAKTTSIISDERSQGTAPMSQIAEV